LRHNPGGAKPFQKGAKCPLYPLEKSLVEEESGPTSSGNAQK